MLNELRKASEGKLILCFVGTGSAFAKRNAHTSVIIAKNGKAILVDCGTSIPPALHANGIKVTDFDGYSFTHRHADHVGGVEELLLMSRYATKTRPSILITENYEEELWNHTLRGGCEFSDAGRLHLSDYADLVRPEPLWFTPREFFKAEFHGIKLRIFRTDHMRTAPGTKRFWSTGLIIERTVIYSGDTRFDPSLFDQCAGQVAGRLTSIFHDCQLFSPGAVHASLEELNTLPPHIKDRMYLMHYGDNWEFFKSQEMGFKDFAEPWKFYEFPLF